MHPNCISLSASGWNWSAQRKFGIETIERNEDFVSVMFKTRLKHGMFQTCEP